MLKRILVVFGIQSVITLILAAIIGMIAIFVGPTLGAVLTTTEAGFAYDIVSPYVCPDGTNLVAEGSATYEEQSSDVAGTTSVTPTEVSCVGDAQVIPNMEIEAFAAISTLTFVACFVPLFFPLALITLLIIWRMTKGMSQKKDSV